ncbi:hypothetical protein ACS0TY_016433 [Phlomoides rotata]
MNAAIAELGKRLVEALKNSVLTDPVNLDGPVGQGITQAAPPTAEELELKKKEIESKKKEDEELQKRLPLYKATLGGDWNNAERIFREDRNALESSVAFTKETVLHAAIGTGMNIDFVQNLIDMMPDDLLDIEVKDDFTPLHVAALAGNTKAAKMLVARRPDLVYRMTTTGLLPIHFAAESGHRETLAYLISITNNNMNFWSGLLGLKLLFYTIDAGFYDVALDMTKKYPSLATLRDDGNGSSALQKIVGKVYVFSRPKRSLMSYFSRHSKYRMRKQALELVKCLCKNIQDRLCDDSEAKRIYSDAMIEAIDAGTSEAIHIILKTFPETVITTLRDREAYTFGLGVEKRCEIVFHLIFQTSCLNRRRYLENSDFEKNNILHRTALLAPQHKLNLVAGAALQMQREMQWYKEVEKLLTPHYREVKNDKEKTPRMIFTEEHKELKKEGAQWMKDTANSCSIATALIATVVFAAAITVPGGNKAESGLPIFFGKMPFLVFAVSDAISLFASITSLLMFLAILTSRFAEEDFHKSLPKRLIIGLISLFISILFMMVAFGATLYVVYGRKKPMIVIPLLVLLGSFPVVAFGLLQFPLLWDAISNTYGRGNLGKQINRLQF